MVVFTCQHCGESVNKPKVDKHYQTKCRYKPPVLTCVDCLKDFNGDEYTVHTQCMTEAQRYSAKGTVFKEPTGMTKQAKYVQMIHSLLNSKNLTVVQRNLLQVCSEHNNVPRKLKKFQNFITNVGRQVKCTKVDVDSVFTILEDAWKKENPIPQNEQKSIVAADVSLNEDKKDDTESKESEDTINGTVEPRKNKKRKHSEGNESLQSEDMQVENVAGTEQENIDESEPKKSRKKKHNEVNRSLSAEMHVESGVVTEDAKENGNGLSKKELKKLKKREKYLNELKHIEKMETNENDDERVEDICDKKKRKKSKMYENNLNEHVLNGSQSEVCEGKKLDIEKEETNTKKSQKRKLNDDSGTEINYKKKKAMEDDLQKPSDEGEAVETEQQPTFDWAQTIIKVLESRSDKELSLKRLGKKVVNEYQIVKSDHRTYEELLAKFNKKVKKTAGVRVLKDKAKLIE